MWDVWCRVVGVCRVGLGRLGCLIQPKPRIGSFKKGDEKDKPRQWPRGRVDPQLFSSALYPRSQVRWAVALIELRGHTPSGVVDGGDQPMDFVVKAGLRATAPSAIRTVRINVHGHGGTLFGPAG